MVDNDIMQAIYLFLSIEDPLEAYLQYLVNLKYLADCKFIYFIDKGGIQMPSYYKTQSIENFEIVNLQSKANVFILDKGICEEMYSSGGEAEYGVDVCIALDTQAVSYLRNVVTEDSTLVYERLHPFMHYLIANDLNFDTSLYFLENSRWSKNMDFIKVYENLLAIERFKAIDINEYCQNKRIIYTLTEHEMKLNADNSFHLMNSENQDAESLFDMYKTIYALLLNICFIEFNYKKKGTKYRTQKLLDFVFEELGIVLQRESMIGILYFLHDTRIDYFFRKVQKNSEKILDTIKGMAWDLAHLRYLERMYSNPPKSNMKSSIYSLITFDKSLIDIVKLVSIERCALYDNLTIPINNDNLEGLLVDIDLSDYYIDLRNKERRPFDMEIVKKLIFDLEYKINMIIVN